MVILGRWLPAIMHCSKQASLLCFGELALAWASCWHGAVSQRMMVTERTILQAVGLAVSGRPHSPALVVPPTAGAPTFSRGTTSELGFMADWNATNSKTIRDRGRALSCLNAPTLAKRGEFVALARNLVHVLHLPVHQAIAFLDERPKLPLGARGVSGARLGFGLGRLGLGLGPRNGRGHFVKLRSELW